MTVSSSATAPLSTPPSEQAGHDLRGAAGAQRRSGLLEPSTAPVARSTTIAASAVTAGIVGSGSGKSSYSGVALPVSSISERCACPPPGSATPARRRRSNRPPTRASGGGPAWSGRTKTRSRDRYEGWSWGLDPHMPREVGRLQERRNPSHHVPGNSPRRAHVTGRRPTGRTWAAETQPTGAFIRRDAPSFPSTLSAGTLTCRRTPAAHRRAKYGDSGAPTAWTPGADARVSALLALVAAGVHIAQRQQPDRRRDLRARSATTASAPGLFASVSRAWRVRDFVPGCGRRRAATGRREIPSLWKLETVLDRDPRVDADGGASGCKLSATQSNSRALRSALKH